MTELPEHIALVHDWLTGMRGGEKVLEVLCELLPSAPIHTLVAFTEKISPVIRAHEQLQVPLKGIDITAMNTMPTNRRSTKVSRWTLNQTVCTFA